MVRPQGSVRAGTCARRWLPALCAAFALSCGGDPEPPSSPGSGGNSGNTPAVQIRGGERLGWTQSTSGADIRTHAFLLFVDGALASLADTRCGTTATPEGYECSGRLPAMAPGSHTIELVAVANGQQSVRSAALRVQVGAAVQPTALAFREESISSSHEAAGPGRSVVATGIGAASWLAATPDGRLIFVEDAARVRIIDGELLPDPAHEVKSGEALVGLAVDPDFTRTRTIYIAHTERGRDGEPSLSISRLREVGNTLGERATIATGLRFAEGAVAPLAVDTSGFIYAALPATAANGAAGVDASDGVVLRLTRDGAVPRANPQGSPLLAVGFARPTAIAVDPARGHVWLAGTHPAWDYSVAFFSSEGAMSSEWPQRPRGALPGAANAMGFKASSLLIAPPSTIGLASHDVVHRGLLAHDGSLASLITYRTDGAGEVTSIALGIDGQLYAALLSPAGQSSAIQLLTPR